MPKPLPLLIRPLAELCADGRTVFLPGGGLALGATGVLAPHDPFAVQANAASMLFGSVATPVFADAALLTPPYLLLLGLLDRQPLDALDLVQVVLPASPDPLSLPGMGQLADTLGVPVAAFRAQLTPDELTPEELGRALPLAQHRVVHLDEAGQMTAAATGVTVRVMPQSSRAPKPWLGVPEEALASLAGKPYLPGRIVFSDKGVELGLPAALVSYQYGSVLRKHGLGAKARSWSGGFDDAAFAAVGAKRVEDLGGYVELLYKMDQANSGKHALVAVDAPAGPSVYLAVSGDARTVSVFDLANSAPALLPKDASRVRFALLPDVLTVEDRLDALGAAWFGTQAPSVAGTVPSWAAATQAEVDLHSWRDAAGTIRTIEVIGSVGNVPAAHLAVLAEAAEVIDEPIVILDTDRPGEQPSRERLALLRRRLEVHGFPAGGDAESAGQVRTAPVVYTRTHVPPAAMKSELTEVLDTYGAALVYEAPGRSADGVGAGLLNLGTAWTARRPGGADGDATDGAAPPVEATLTVELIRAATNMRRAPAFTSPGVPVAAFLSSPLNDPEAIVAALRRDGSALPDQHAQLAGVVERVPSFAGHHAVLSLTKPLLQADATSSGSLGRMAPLLAELAGVRFNDNASHAILGAIGDLIEDRTTHEEAKDAIWRYRRDLPQGNVRSDWIRKINALTPLLPEHHKGVMEWVAVAIMTCPDSE
ncbi:hypothetical protein [Dactylosporangium sp. CA-233914]|uniref:hypothetical protein n=1 Tax=Dactylosporangium sp. CA-233914 TaxID=3239934 RepID=UPI003D92F6F9